MARHEAAMPRAESDKRQVGQGREGASGTTGGTETARGAAPGSTYDASTTSRGEQERQRDVTREQGSAGAGMQRSAAGRSSGALAGRGQGQPSLLPAFMASPGLMASAFMSDPFTFAQAMSDEMDRLFSSYGFGTAPFGQREGASGREASGGRSQALQRGQQQGGRVTRWMPPMEVFQRGKEMVVRADLPGLSPEDVQIEIEDGVLTVSGERRQEHEDRQEGWYRSERSYGAFSRSIALPEGVNEDQVQARFDQGVLEVTVPVPEQRETRGRRVQIQSGSGKSASQPRGAESAKASHAGLGTQSAQSPSSSSGQGRSTTAEKR